MYMSWDMYRRYVAILLLLVIVAQAGTVQVSIGRSTVAHPYDGNQLINKKEPTNTCNSHMKKISRTPC